MILDEGFDKIKILKIDAHNSELLTVNNRLWNDEVNKYDRKYNMGCAALIVVAPMLSFTLSFILSNEIGFYIFLIAIMLGLFYKLINTWRCSQLKIHTVFEYEIAHDRVVRYDTSEYLIFHFHEIKFVEDKQFGLILWKRKPFVPFLSLHLLRYTNKELLVIPNQLQSYEQVKKYLLSSIQ